MSKFTILRKQTPKPELNIAPLIDMVFLLLIFFMVATTMQKESGITIQRPRAETAQALSEDSLVIAVTDTGEYFFENKKLSIGELKALFGDDKTINAEKNVIILADEKAYTKAVIDLLDALRAVGVNNLSIAAEKP